MSSLISILLLCLVLSVCGRQKYDDEEETDNCTQMKCVGKEYECINGNCYCADGYIPNHFHNKCIKCPGLNQKCFGYCCSNNSSITLTCWQGVCKSCLDDNDNWTCRGSLDNILLISSAQIAMATALVFGIIATFVLLYKLCAVTTTLRPLGDNHQSRLSIGSLQVYIEERLRDAPPRYSGALPSESILLPAAVHDNAGFVHDSSVPPPPPYTPRKAEDNPNSAIHI